MARTPFLDLSDVLQAVPRCGYHPGVNTPLRYIEIPRIETVGDATGSGSKAAAGSLPLGAASRLLGVHPDTLRRWSDEGRVRSYLTPGGHRRFERSSLERLRRSGARDRASLEGLGLTETRVVARYRRSYRAPISGRPDPRAVAGPVDAAAFRDEGRRLIASLIASLDAVDADARAAAREEASTLVRSHATRLAGRRAALVDAVSLFVAAREPFLAEVGQVARRRSSDPQQLTRLFEEATALLDRLLLEFIEVYRTVSQGVS